MLSTFGRPTSRATTSTPVSGTQFYYPAQAVQGPDGTIYTADPLYTMEATSPEGFLKGSTTLGGDLDFGGWGFALVGSTFYFQSGRPVRQRGRRHLVVLPGHASDRTWAPSRPRRTSWAGGRASPRRPPATTSPPGTTPAVDATFDPWWAPQASHLELSYSVENDASLNAETVPAPTVVPLPTTATGLAVDPADHPGGATPRPGPYEVQATLLDTSTTPPTTLGHHLHALHGGRHRRQPRLRHPARRGRAPAARPTPGAWPSTPSSACRACAA